MLADEVEIVVVTDLDAAWAEIESLLRQLHEHHVPLVGRELLPDWADRHRRLLDASIESPDARVLLARRSGRSVGFANGRVLRDPAVMREAYGFIDNVSDAADERRSGIGSLLLATLEEWFIDRGVREAQLSVVAANVDAVRLWEARGFERLALRMQKLLGD